MFEQPAKFKGEHDNIEQFLRDCNAYFRVFCHSFLGIPSLMIVFATGLFEGYTQSWWVHQREEYWWVPDDMTEPSCYQYPSWEDFCELVKERFRNPAVQEKHEQEMKEMKMGSDSAALFFQKLKQKAKLAGWQNDTGE